MEFEAPRPTIPYEEPFVPHAGPVVENLVSFDQESTVRHNRGNCGLKNSCETFFTQHFNQARSSGLQRCKHILQDSHIVLLVVEVSKRSKHTDHKSKSAWANKITHVFLNPFDLEVCGLGFCPRLIEEACSSVNSGNPESLFCEGDATSAWTAAEIEDGLACGSGECRYLRDLLVRIGDALLWKHERVKLTPERVVVEPLFFALHGFHRSAEYTIRAGNCLSGDC